jgi:magnesium-transporting ATPase (P-type)
VNDVGESCSRLVEDEAVPCDLVVLSTSHDQGQCYVMTANLDGETSLKTRHSATVTKGREGRWTMSSQLHKVI